METQINNKRSVPVLILFLSALSVLLYYSTIYLFPSFIHAWTQSDHYAIALRFLDNGFDIFHPATFNLQTTNGITRSDLPLNEFFVAIVMKIAGSTAPVIFRLYTLVVSITGMVFLYLMTKRITASEIKAWILVLFVFLSPVYVYYQAGFIPSVPAIACIFAGYYYFFLYKDLGIKKHLVLFVCLFSIAALMRSSFLIFLLAVSIQQLFMMVKNRKLNVPEIVFFIVSFIILGVNYLHKVHLGRVYGNIFLDGISPAKNGKELSSILYDMYDQWSFHYFTVWHYLFMFVLIFISVLTFYKRKKYIEEDKKYWFQFCILSVGMLCYFFMSSEYFIQDYYFLDSFFIPVILLLLFVIKNLPVDTLNEKSVWTAAFGISVILFFFADKKIQKERYHSGPWDRAEITHRNFEGTEQFLDSVGIPKDAKILVIDAYTANSPLILMNRMGYTVMGTSPVNISVALQWCKWDYVAIQDGYLVSDVIKNYPLITSMLDKKTGTGKVTFYERSRAYKTKTLKEFLDINNRNVLFSTLVTFDSSQHDPHITNLKNIVSGKKGRGTCSRLDSLTEFGTNVIVLAGELQQTKNVKALITCDFLSESPMDDIQLVASILSKGEQLFYQNFMVKDYFHNSAEWQKMEFQFVFPELRTPEDEVKIYLWNPSGKELDYDNLQVTIYR